MNKYEARMNKFEASTNFLRERNEWRGVCARYIWAITYDTTDWGILLNVLAADHVVATNFIV